MTTAHDATATSATETWRPDPPTAEQMRRWRLEPDWSRHVDVASHDGAVHRWHLLDTGPVRSDSNAAPPATVVCIHGNPTWAYAWSSLLRSLGDRHRLIAVDQLGMGFSDRVGTRRYADRVADLADVVAALDLPGPLVIAGHDWGGAVAMGWAVDHPDRLAGLVLCNTGIAVPAGRRAPGIIRLAASAPLRDLVCRRTSTFVEGTLRLSRGRIDAIDREAFRAPYRSTAARNSIADFVADIPLVRPHPSADALDGVAARLGQIDAPVLLAWGSQDPVFDDDFAVDLDERIPTTVLHRFPRAGHLVTAEADVADVVDAWLSDLVATESERHDEPAPPGVAGQSLWSALEARRDDDDVALVDMASATSVTWRDLVGRIDGIAAELSRRGLIAGDRVAMLAPPGVDMIAAVYGVWRAGGVTVIADRGLGLGGLGQAVRSARPAWRITSRAARVASTALRWAPHARSIDLEDLIAGAANAATGALEPPDATALAAVLFTSGATGPAKGVRYRLAQLAAQRDALAATYGITSDDRLVAAFAPFALYGPALGVPTALPDCDVTAPGSLTVGALDEACRAVGATMMFASPAALANVASTAEAAPGVWPGLAGLRIAFSAGAPVPAEILHSVAALAPDASLHTPYGMTEALPIADADLGTIDAADIEMPAAGVCVGAPVTGAQVRIAPLGFDALAGAPDPVPDGDTGEILVRAPWVSDGYVGLWHTERMARPGDGWHRTGDVGHVDRAGRLWVEGRSVHVVHTAAGPITSVPVERVVERAGIEGVRAGRVAAVGIGPVGCQQLVIVIESPSGEPGLAHQTVARSVRNVVEHPVAAVLVTDRLPVDIRHNAKIDRRAVAAWADGVLAGGRPGARTGLRRARRRR